MVLIPIVFPNMNPIRTTEAKLNEREKKILSAKFANFSLKRQEIL